MSENSVPQVIPISNKDVKDIAGQHFGTLHVLGYVGSRLIGAKAKSRAHWLCACDCGTHLVVDGANLRSGNTKNCGCKKSERSRALGNSNRTHGMKRTPEYRSWRGMKGRCQNPNHEAYARYGGRGIKVCDRWCNSFENFIEDMGMRPSHDHSLDRIDNDGDYTPDNCRWATLFEQGNNRSVNQPLTHNGVTLSIAQWARAMDMRYDTLWSRLFKGGWTIERGLTTPVHQ